METDKRRRSPDQSKPAKPVKPAKPAKPAKTAKEARPPKRPKPTKAVLQRMLNAARAFHSVVDLPSEPLAASFANEQAARAALVDATLFEAHQAFSDPVPMGRRDPTLHALDLGSVPGIVADPKGKEGVAVYAAVDRPTTEADDVVARPKRVVKKRGCLQAVTSAARLEERRALKAEERRTRPKKPRQPRQPKPPADAADDADSPFDAALEPGQTVIDAASGKWVRSGEPAGDDGPDGQAGDGGPANHSAEPANAPANHSAEPANAPASDKPAKPRAKRQPAVEEMIVVAHEAFGEHDLYESPASWVQQLRVLGESAPLDANMSATLVGGADTGAVELVVGPPGTGKSVELLSRVAGAGPGRVLVTAPTNLAVADLYRRYRQGRAAGAAALVMRAERVPGQVPEGRLDPEESGDARVVFATAATVTLACMRRTEPFEHVFVDEAGMLPEAATWCVLRPETSRLVLCGDPAQLEGMVSDEGRGLKFGRSLFRRLLDLGHPAHRLKVQRRMHPDIAALTVDRFYAGQVATEYRFPDVAAELLGVRVVRVNGQEQAVGTSQTNEAEAVAAIERARELAEAGLAVVVLCPYSAQAARCTELAGARGAGCAAVEVATVDAFQGREADAVVLSMVRNGRRGFWSSDERMCVAMTRARHHLTVLAAPEWSDADLGR